MYYALLLLIIPFCAWAEVTWKADLPPPFKIILQFDKESLALDEAFQMQAIFHYPSSYQLDGQALIDQLIWSGNPFISQVALGDFQIRSSFEKEVQTLDLQAILYPMKEGKLTLSFLTVLFKSSNEGQSSVKVKTPLFHMKVLPSALDHFLLQTAPLAPLDTQFPLGLTEVNRQLLIENRTQMAEEKAHNQSLWKKTRLSWLTLFLFVCLGALLGTIYGLRKRLFPPKPPLPWDPRLQVQIALKTVEKEKGNPQAIKNYYTELVVILYRLLQDGWGLPVRAMTTNELRQCLAFLPLPSKTKEDMLSFLIEADRIKFAAKTASGRNVQLVYEHLLTWIDQVASRKQAQNEQLSR